MFKGRSKVVIISCQPHKISQQLQADFLAFFGVKLGGEDVVAPDGGGEGVAIFGAGGDDAGIGGLRVEAVDKIDVAAAGDAAVEGAVGAGDIDLVPADLRDFQTVFNREADHAAGENAQAGGAGVEFFAAVKQRLVTDADTEKWFAGVDEVAGGFQQFLFAEGVDAVIEGADAGQDQAAGVADLFRFLHQADVGTHLEQRFVDAAQVAGTVIKQSNHVVKNRRRDGAFKS